MRFAVETTGTLLSTEETLSRAALETAFELVADALAGLSGLEADVAVNLDTAELEFYIVVEAPGSREAFALANQIQDSALAKAGFAVEWNGITARRADLVPA